ncbi:uncharacterized protein LOC112046862 [Bicyclus anynana]|uniref:Uncharacterized protein LOC112046862 n=1 Tax=Bicyclus anynana TaxID=110368 RepID=A0ABM3LZ96_BICAN|nr:uncharacterized protein LOC112046862 [Bicyclus anynana]
MRPLTLGFIFLTVIAFAHQEPIESLNHVLVYPMEPGTKKTKREVTAVKSQQNEFNQFVEEKLIQLTQALEHLVKLAQTNENTIKELIITISSNYEKPKLPEKIEVQHKTRRSNIVKNDPPIVRFGRNVPKYGMFFKDLILAELRNDEEPVAVAEHVLSTSKNEVSGL